MNDPSTLEVQTSAQFVERYCNAFGLRLCENNRLQAVAHNKGRACPDCKRKPRLYAHMIERGVGRFNFSRAFMGAGVLLCGCGRSSTLFDERSKVERGNTDFLFDAERVANLLADSWNATAGRGVYG